MQMLSLSVTCPTCGATATITLIEHRDSMRYREGDRLEFRCSQRRHDLSESQLRRLWADTQGENLSDNDVA